MRSERDEVIFNSTYQQLLPTVCKYLGLLTAIWNPDALFMEWRNPLGMRCVMPIRDSVKISVELDALNKQKFTYAFKKLSPLDRAVKIAANTTQCVDAIFPMEMSARAQYDPALIEEAWQLLQDVAMTAQYNRATLISMKHVEILVNGGGPDRFTPSQLWQLYKIVRGCRSRPPFDLVTNHDGFFCHPNYRHHLQPLYREIAAQVAEMDYLQSVVREYTGNDRYVYTKVDSGMPDAIRDMSRGRYLLS